MKKTPRALALTMLLAGAWLAVARAQTDLQLDRLVATGTLWATVKYFHPAIDEANPRAWDDVLRAAIPRVQAARRREEYASALGDMLGALRDPVTTIEEEKPLEDTVDCQFGFARFEDRARVLIAKSGCVDGDPLATRDELMRRLPGVGGVVFDLRAGPVFWGLWWWSLTSEPLAFPAHRFRVHVGMAPQRGATDVPFYSGFMTRSAPVFPPASEWANKTVVFLVNDSTQLPPIAAALQGAGRAFIVSETPIDDRAMARHPMTAHHRVSLGEGLTAHVRTSEMVHADGTVGLIADRIAAGDGLPLALQAASGGVPHAARPPSRAAYQIKAPEDEYDDSPFPAEDLRLLAAFRIWAAFEWLFPYRDLMDHDWTQVLRRMLPKFAAARNAREYQLAVSEMVAHTGDSHATLYFPSASQPWRPLLDELWGPVAPGIELRAIEGRPVVVAVADGSNGISVGDVVVAVDGQAADERLAALRRFIAASTPQALERDAMNYLLRGSDGSVARLRFEHADGGEHERALPRRHGTLPQGDPSAPGAAFRLIEEGIGYIDLRVLQNHQVDAAFAALKGTTSIVFDMRGYPNGTFVNVLRHLAGRPEVTTPPLWIPVVLEPGMRSVLEIPPVLRLGQPAPRYKGRTVMLIDERAQSQAEYTGQLFRAVHDTRFIGSPTTGANGDGSNIGLPGGLRVGMSGAGVKNHDGSPLQRRGLQPDVLVRPTIAGIRAGRDEVLERAVAFLRGR